MKAEEIRYKMGEEVGEEVRRLFCYFDYWEDEDKEEISKSLSKMWEIGFNYANQVRNSDGGRNE